MEESQFSSEQDHADTIIMRNEHITPYCLFFAIRFAMRHILEVLHTVLSPFPVSSPLKKNRRWRIMLPSQIRPHVHTMPH